MILVLSGGGNEAREFAALLERDHIPHLCVFSSFADAGSYGRGNAVVGRMKQSSLEGIFRRNPIRGVVDVMAGGNNGQSAAAMAACGECGMPYVKYLRLPIARGAYDHVMVSGSYRAAADYINAHLGHVLFYAMPETVRMIAGQVLDQSCLYTPILRGISFDVELALEFGIPLVNVMELDGIDGVAAVSNAIERIDAKLLICDGATSILDKVSAAEQKKIQMIVTHKMGIEYTRTALSGAETLNIVKGWLGGGKEKQEG